MKSKIFKALTAGALALGLLAPAISLAETRPLPTRDGAKADLRVKTASANFCARFTESEGKLRNGLSDKGNLLADKRIERDVLRQKKVGERQTKLTEKRSESNLNRDGLYSKLEARATTDAQKAAIATFKEKVDAAVAVHRVAVDEALSAFLAGVEQAKAAHRSSVDGIVAANKVSVDAAVAQAKSDCAGGVASETVRSTLQAALKSAKETMKSSREALTPLGQVIQPLIETRKTAVKAAHDAFKTTLEAAKAELKAALSQKEEAENEVE